MGGIVLCARCAGSAADRNLVRGKALAPACAAFHLPAPGAIRGLLPLSEEPQMTSPYLDRPLLPLAVALPRMLTRISHRGRCIGAPFLRKSCWLNGLSQGQGESRCRQSVARRYSNLHASKGALWWARLMAVRSPRMPVPFCWRRRIALIDRFPYWAEGAAPIHSAKGYGRTIGSISAGRCF